MCRSILDFTKCIVGMCYLGVTAGPNAMLKLLGHIPYPIVNHHLFRVVFIVIFY